MGIKCISFSLYGTDEKYLIGALKNVELAKILFPNYTCYFFIDHTVPKKYIAQLNNTVNTKLIDMSSSDLPPMMWRFTAIDLPEVELMLVRDTDSRLSEREKNLVNLWINEHTNFMIIKDHPYCHRKVQMYGGMWAMQKVAGLNIAMLIRNWLPSTANVNAYGADQSFLDEYVYPLALNSLSYYDNYNINQLPICKAIPFKRKNWDFIGEIHYANGTRGFQWKSLRGYHFRQAGVVGYIASKILNVFNPEWPKRSTS